jgi:hypothetical protein
MVIYEWEIALSNARGIRPQRMQQSFCSASGLPLIITTLIESTKQGEIIFITPKDD